MVILPANERQTVRLANDGIERFQNYERVVSGNTDQYSLHVSGEVKSFI